MKNKLAGRLSLQEAIASTLAETKEKLAAAKGDKEKKLVEYEKKEHGHLPSVKEEKEECSEKTSSVLNLTDPEEVEKLASALEFASEKLAGNKVDIGGESHQGGESLPVMVPVGGKQAVSKAHATPKYVVPSHTGMMSPKDNKGAATAVPTDDNRAPGGTGAKYPAKGVLKTGGVAALQAEVEKAAAEDYDKSFALEDIERARLKKSLTPEEKAHYEASEAYAKGALKHMGIGAGVGGLAGLAGGAYLLGKKVPAHDKVDKALNTVLGGYAGGMLGAGLGGLGGAAVNRLRKGAPPKLNKEKESSAVDYLLSKISNAEIGGESKQGGETLANHAPVPSNPGRQMIRSNAAPKAATKHEAKAPRKAELKQVLTEPAMSAKHDDVVQKNLRNASKGGVKIAAAKALLQKIAEEGCQCGGDVTCRYCKMKSAAANLKKVGTDEKSTETAAPQTA